MAHEAIVLVSAGNMPRPLAKVKCARDTKGIRRQSGLFLSESHPHRRNLQSGASPGGGLAQFDGTLMRFTVSGIWSG
jgi:hypothetical protein